MLNLNKYHVFFVITFCSVCAAVQVEMIDVLKDKNIYDEKVVTIEGFLILNGEERALYQCDDNVDTSMDSFIYIDLFTMQPDRSNFEVANNIANNRYLEFKRYHEKCVSVTGKFSVTESSTREEGFIIVSTIEPFKGEEN